MFYNGKCNALGREAYQTEYTICIVATHPTIFAAQRK